jgi:dTMP kinase
MRGLLVTCEGIDGSGKSTAAAALVEALRREGRDARLHAEPTRSWLGEAVRRGVAEDAGAWSEALLFMADHALHVQQVAAEIERGALVVSDRWSDSTFAYQGAALEGLGIADPIAWLRQTERPFDRAPDLTLLFDLDVTEALRRVAARSRGAREKFEQSAFLDRVRRNYLRLAKEEPDRFVTVDAARPPRAVLADALAAVRRRL